MRQIEELERKEEEIEEQEYCCEYWDDVRCCSNVVGDEPDESDDEDFLKHVFREVTEEEKKQWQEIKERYRVNGTTHRFDNMTRTMFRTAKAFPWLKGRGADVKALGLPLMQVFAEHMDASLPELRHVLAALEASVTMEQILEQFQDQFGEQCSGC